MRVFWPSGNTAGVSKHVGLQWDVLEILVKLGHQLQVWRVCGESERF